MYPRRESERIEGGHKMTATDTTTPQETEVGFADLVADLTPASVLAADLMPIEALNNEAGDLP